MQKNNNNAKSILTTIIIREGMNQLIMKNQLINTEMSLENYLNSEEKLPRKLGDLHILNVFNLRHY